MKYEVIRIKDGQYEDDPEYETNNYHAAMDYCQKTMKQERNWAYSEMHKDEALVIMKVSEKNGYFELDPKKVYEAEDF